MAYSNLICSGNTGVINAAAYITELTSSGTSRYVKVKITVWAIDYSGARDASYSVKCSQSGTNVSVPMYNGFTINGSEATIFDKSFYVSVAQGSSTASIDLTFTASLISPSSGTRSISGTITTLYLTAEPDEPEIEPTKPSTMQLSPNPVKIGQGLLITFDRDNLSCTHNLYYIPSSGKTTEITVGAAASYLWTVPDLSTLCKDSDRTTLTIRCDTYEGDSYVGRTVATVTILLPDATKPSCQDTAAMGNNLAITLERKASVYTHDLSYTMGNKSGVITTEAGASCSWNVPLELAKEIPLLTRGSCTITCVTRNGTLEIGRETVAVMLTVPDNEQTKPTGSMELSPTGGLGESFRGLYIRGRTGVKAEFTGQSEYSQVERYELTVDGITTKGNPAESAYLNSHGTVTVTGRIIDARGYAREITQEIAVIAYDKPRVVPYEGEAKVVAVRCDYPDGTRNPKGQSLLIRAGRKYTALNTGGNQLNFCELSFRYKTSASENFSDYYTLISEDNLNGDFANAVNENAVPDLKTGYTVQVRASDTLGNYSVITVPVAALTLPFHIGKGNGNVAVGKYCDYSRENAFEIALTTYFDTGIALREIFQGGSWAQGADLGSTVAAADTGAVGSYTLFMGVLNQEPVWLMKVGNKIRGSGVTITLNDSIITLDTAPAAMTALYAVL